MINLDIRRKLHERGPFASKSLQSARHLGNGLPQLLNALSQLPAIRIGDFDAGRRHTPYLLGQVVSRAVGGQSGTCEENGERGTKTRFHGYLEGCAAKAMNLSRDYSCGK
jgi:hypothetical protein